MFDRAKAVKHVVQDLFSRPLQRIAIAATAGAVEYVNIARRDAKAGELRRHVLDVVRTGDVVDVDFADLSGIAAENAPRHVMVPFVLVGNEGVGQHALRLDDAEAAAETPRAGQHIVAQLVTIADHRQVHRQIFNRIIAGIGHQAVDAVRTVRARTAAIRALIDLEKNPVIP